MWMLIRRCHELNLSIEETKMTPEKLNHIG